MLNAGDKVELIEVECGQDPECPIPVGVVVTAFEFQHAAKRLLPEGEIGVRWETPDFGPDVDCWPEDRLKVIL